MKEATGESSHSVEHVRIYEQEAKLTDSCCLGLLNVCVPAGVKSQIERDDL